MSVYVVDASVAAKWFLVENHSASARRLCGPNHRLHVPALFDLEFTNIVCKKIRRQEITLDEGREILDLIDRAPLQRHPDNMLRPTAFDLANQTFRSLYDCLYVVLAIGLKSQLVTADRKLFDGLAETPVTSYLCWIDDLP